MIRITPTPGPDGLTLQVQGRLDASTSGDLDQAVDEAIRGGAHRLRFNLAEVEFISSAGLRVLLRTYNTLRKLGGVLVVAEPSPAVRQVLSLSNLLGLLAVDAPIAPPARPGDTPPPSLDHASLRYTVVESNPAAALRVRLIGDPGRLAHQGYAAAGSTPVRFPPGSFGLGLGAFGPDFADCRHRFGELLAAGGAAVCLPAGGAEAPDYVVSRADLVPAVQALYAIVAEGGFARQARFESTSPDGASPLSDLVGLAGLLAGGPAFGLVALAETAGLIGASLHRSPASDGTAGLSFEHPEIRDWISFTPEREHARSLVLLVGFIETGGPQAGPLAPFLRPIGPPGTPLAHLHAAAFTFRALPGGRLDPSATITGLFEEERLLGLLHLIQDHREITGVGESLFRRGALWAAPVGEARPDAQPGTEAPA